MKRNRLIAIGLLVFNLSIGGCKKKQNEAEQSEGSVAEQVAKAKSQLLGDDLDIEVFAEYFDAEVTLVVGLNVGTLLKSSSFVDNQEQLEDKLPVEIGNIVDICGFSPLKELEHLVVAGDKSYMKNADGRSLVWGQGLSKDKVEKCAKSVLAKEDKTFVVEKKDGYFSYKFEGEAFDLAWLTDSSFLMSPDIKHRDWFKQRIAKQNSLASDKEKMATLKRANRRSGVWFTALQAKGAKDLEGIFGSLPIKNGTGVYGEISLDDGLAVSGAVMFEDESLAERATNESIKSLKEFSEAAPIFGTYTNKLKLENKKEELTFSYTMTKEELEGLANFATQQVTAPQ